MKFVVIGGSGLIGRQVVNVLRERGHEVVAASPSAGVNAMTGEGLAQALNGAEVVIDVSNAPSSEPTAVLEFFDTSARNLAAAEAAAGVGHHVLLSVVGTDRLPVSSYFRAKLAQENLINSSEIPYTAVRSTQFFEFLGAIADAGTNGPSARLSTAALQPIAAADVAAILADIALAPQVNGTVEIAGPERAPLSEMVSRCLASKGDRRSVLPDARAPYFGTRLEEDSLVPGTGSRLGGIGLDDWLARNK
jgi:uncharacterized protein YbjT (DUF2867 family)